MSLLFNIPHKNKFNTPTAVFRGIINNPTVGVYDFNVVTNNITMFKLERNSVYLVERISVGSNVSEEIYLNSIESVSQNPPTLFFSSLLTGEVFFTQKLAVVGFYPDKQTTVFLSSDKGNDALQVKFSGVLDQIWDTVGKTEIDIILTMSVYEINNKEFKIWYEKSYHDIKG